jgi:hypothetical protein
MIGSNDFVLILIAFFSDLLISVGLYRTQKNRIEDQQLKEKTRSDEFQLKVNIDIAKLNEKYISMEKEILEHKDGNEKSFNKLESMIETNTQNNRDDHGKIFDELRSVSKELIQATRTIIGNTK